MRNVMHPASHAHTPAHAYVSMSPKQVRGPRRAHTRPLEVVELFTHTSGCCPLAGVAASTNSQ